MNTYRQNASIVGVLLIIGFVGILSLTLTGPILDDPDYLVEISVNKNRIISGVLVQLIMAFATASIAIWLYPVLKKYHEALALGAASFRIIEGVFQIVSAVSLLALLTLSQDFVKAGAPDSSHFQTLGGLLLAGRDWVGQVATILPWILGALMYYYVFYQTKLVPRWLSVWGLVGSVLAIVATMLFMFGFIAAFSPNQVMLMLPIASQEIVLAIWLIAKGFNSDVIASQFA